MRLVKKTGYFNLLLVPLLIIGLSVVLIGSISAEDEMPTSDAIRVIEVDTLNYDFEPEVIRVEPGEEVKFVVRNPSSAFHTFTVYHSQSERENPIVDISLNTGDEKTVTVTMPEEEKTLYLVCLPHEGMGMVGQVIVGNPE